MSAFFSGAFFLDVFLVSGVSSALDLRFGAARRDWAFLGLGVSSTSSDFGALDLGLSSSEFLVRLRFLSPPRLRSLPRPSNDLVVYYQYVCNSDQHLWSKHNEEERILIPLWQLRMRFVVYD